MGESENVGRGEDAMERSGDEEVGSGRRQSVVRNRRK
jgi:hypothetical protein